MKQGTFWNSQFRIATTHHRHAGTAQSKLCVEALEDRITPSTFIVDTLVDETWNNGLTNTAVMVILLEPMCYP